MSAARDLRIKSTRFSHKGAAQDLLDESVNS